MYSPDQILQIEAALVLSRRPLPAFLKECEVDQSTWWRWRHEKSEPSMASWRKVLDAMERLGIQKVAA